MSNSKEEYIDLKELLKPPVNNKKVIAFYRVLEDYFLLCKGQKKVWNAKFEQILPDNIQRTKRQQQKIINTLRIIKQYRLTNPITILRMLNTALIPQKEEISIKQLDILRAIINNPHLKLKDIRPKDIPPGTFYNMVRALKEKFVIRYWGILDPTRFKLVHYHITIRVNASKVHLLREAVEKSPFVLTLNIDTLTKIFDEYAGWMSFRVPNQKTIKERFLRWLLKLQKERIFKDETSWHLDEVTSIEYGINIDFFDGERWRLDEISVARGFLHLAERTSYTPSKPMTVQKYSYEEIDFDRDDLILATLYQSNYYTSLDSAVETLRKYGFKRSKKTVFKKVKRLKELCIKPAVSMYLNLPVTLLAFLENVRDIDTIRRFLGFMPRYWLYTMKDGDAAIFLQLPKDVVNEFKYLFSVGGKEGGENIYDDAIIIESVTSFGKQEKDELVQYWNKKRRRWEVSQDVFMI